MNSPAQSSLAWPRSDGDQSIWPEYKDPKNSGFWLQLPRKDAKFAKKDEQKIKAWKEKIGKFLVTEVLNVPGYPSPSIDFPDGYALFVYLTPQADGSNREDVYLCGCTSTFYRFRSPQEFSLHAKWLFSTNMPLDDHTRCFCKYSVKSTVSTSKRRSVGESGSPDPKKLKASPSESYSGTVVPERSIDTRTKRRFRKGELVFIRIPTIAPPPGSGLPEITHWPGLIARITSRTSTAGSGLPQGTATAVRGSTGGNAPAELAPELTFDHHIRLLGLFSTSQESEVVRSTAEILPWAVSEEILGGLGGWNKIGQESNRVLREGVERETKVDIPSHDDLKGAALEERWRKRWGERIAFEPMALQGNWDLAVLRLGTALKTAKTIANSWTQTDKVDVFPPGTEFPVDDIKAIEKREKVLFQGAWFQGERIWIGDMVRLCQSRRDLPPDSILAPSPGSEGRGVFMKIRNISVEIDRSGGRIPASPVESGIWRCVLDGDLYELSSTGSNDEPHDVAPHGLHYRRLHDKALKVTIDIWDVAGRAYPNLLESDAAWYYAPGADATGRVEAGDKVLALVGLRPSTRGSGSRQWKEDLYSMVRDATRDVERQTREHYAKLLSSALGYSTASTTSGKNDKTSTTPTFKTHAKGTKATPSSMPTTAPPPAPANGLPMAPASVPPAALSGQPPTSASPASVGAGTASTSTPIASTSTSSSGSQAPSTGSQAPSAASQAPSTASPAPSPVPFVANAVIVLPFTPAFCINPEPLLKAIFGLVKVVATETVTIIFSTPNSPVQLYSALQASPRKSFKVFQRFLGGVYSALIRGQTAADLVQLGVEVHFDGEPGDWRIKVPAPPSRVYRFNTYPTLASHITASWPHVSNILLSMPPDAPGNQSVGSLGGPDHFSVGAVGGTFDHLHGAHKLLLQMALFTTKDRLVVGVTTDSMLSNKSDLQFLQPQGLREGCVRSFLSRFGQDTKIDIVPLTDPSGPTATDAEIQAITVSRETETGATAVNKTRKEKGLPLLEVMSVDVISATVQSEGGAGHVKFGSSAIRAWMARKHREKFNNDASSEAK